MKLSEALGVNVRVQNTSSMSRSAIKTTPQKKILYLERHSTFQKVQIDGPNVQTGTRMFQRNGRAVQTGTRMSHGFIMIFRMIVLSAGIFCKMFGITQFQHLRKQLYWRRYNFLTDTIQNNILDLYAHNINMWQIIQSWNFNFYWN